MAYFPPQTAPAQPPIQTIVAWHSVGTNTPPPDTVSTVLGQHHCCVFRYAQASKVLWAVLRQEPDMLLIYLQTSGEAGYQLSRRLRRLPQTRDLPIVFVGLRNQRGQQEKALRCGGSDYLQQPISKRECWLRLENHLRVAERLRQLQAEKASLYQQLWAYNLILQQQAERQLHLSQENQALQRDACTDGLTQVANRRYFNHRIVQLWQQAYLNQQPLSLLLCDIDYFKRYNDYYGHLAGDRCLQKVAEALQQGAHRHGDQVARYGGEEFAILLPATDTQGAQQVALSVQTAVTQLHLPHAASSATPFVSLSIGLYSLAPESREQSYEMLIQGADEALYSAKLQGRNRTVVKSGLAPTAPVPLLEAKPSPALPPNSSNSSGLDKAVYPEKRRQQPKKSLLNPDFSCPKQEA